MCRLEDSEYSTLASSKRKMPSSVKSCDVKRDAHDKISKVQGKRDDGDNAAVVTKVNGALVLGVNKRALEGERREHAGDDLEF
eukprot:2396485-Pleurochrysis_carterae.AAC.3